MAVREMNARGVGLLLAAVILIFGVLTGAWAFALHRNFKLATNFARVHAGLTDNEVLAVLGRPSWVEPCGKSFGTPRNECVDYIYRNSFAPLIPEYWSVSFNTRKQVVDTYVYESP